MPTEIAPGVYTLDHRVVEGKNAVLFGARGALAIDCGTDPDEGRASLNLAKGRRPESLWLAMTHCHGDHALGSAAFLEIGCEVVAHDAFASNLQRHLARRASREDGASGDDMEGRLVWPTLTFSDELRLDLGGKTLRFLHTPGHSADSCCVFVEEEKILFGGDTVVTCIPPAFGDGDSRELEGSIGRLRELPVETLVPGHGPVLRGAEQIRGHLEWMVGYLRVTRAAVERTRREGREEWVEAAIGEAPAERVYGAHMVMDRHRNDGRHRATVVKLIEELVAAPGDAALPRAP